MPQDNFEIWINDETKILLIRITEKGHYVSFAVVLVILTEAKWVQIGRFDTAHGTAHQDVLGKRAGLLQKIWLDHLSPRQAFKLAISTFEENHERIRNQYFAN